MMQYDTIIAKLGGGILQNKDNLSSTITQFKQLLGEKIIKKIIIIPGGGSLANDIRRLDKEVNLGDDEAHWKAIKAMDSNGIILNKKYPHFKLVDNFNNLKLHSCQIIIFNPFEYLKKMDELPHSWDVTSDSITLYLAYKLNLNICFLIKDVDGIFDMNNQMFNEISTKDLRISLQENKIKKIKIEIEDLKKSKPIDSYLLNLIDKFKVECVLLNGSYQQHRIINFFNKPTSKMTKIIF